MSNDRIERDLEQAFFEIDTDSSLAAGQRIKAKAALMKEYRVVTGAPMAIANKTPLGTTLGQSIARTAGRELVRALFKKR